VKISIIGAAGTIGSCAAFSIAIHGITDELVMIDNFSVDKLEGYVGDLSTAVTGLDTTVRAGNYEDLRGSDIVIMAAGSAQVMVNRMEVLPQNLPIIKDIALSVQKYCPGAIIITATNPVDPLNYAMYLASGFDRKKCIGYSINDSIRFRMFVAKAMNLRSSQVEATAIGEHGPSQVLLFSSVKVKGKTAKVTPEVKQSVRDEVANLPKVMEPQRIKSGRTQGWVTSMGLTAMCKAISHNTLEVMPGSVVLNGEYGYRNLSLSVPVALGKEGVHEIQVLKLEPEERDGMEKSVNTLRPTMEYAESILGKRSENK
jgi:malate dehydrogenase